MVQHSNIKLQKNSMIAIKFNGVAVHCLSFATLYFAIFLIFSKGLWLYFYDFYSSQNVFEPTTSGKQLSTIFFSLSSSHIVWCLTSFRNGSLFGFCDKFEYVEQVSTTGNRKKENKRSWLLDSILLRNERH